MANCLACSAYLGPVNQTLCDRCMAEAGGRLRREHPILALILVLVPVVFYGWLMIASSERARRYREEGRGSPTEGANTVPTKPASRVRRADGPARVRTQTRAPSTDVQKMSVNELEQWLRRGKEAR